MNEAAGKAAGRGTVSVELCDQDCNRCPVILHPNSRMVTFILNALLQRFRDDVSAVVQKACPNLTVCADCRIDDFCHTEGCRIAAKVLVPNPSNCPQTPEGQTEDPARDAESQSLQFGDQDKAQ